MITETTPKPETLEQTQSTRCRQRNTVLLRSLNSAAQAEIERLARVLFHGSGSDCKTILFAEADSGDHSSEWVVLHMAHTLAASGRRTHAICLHPHSTPTWNTLGKTYPLSDLCKAEWLAEADSHTDLARTVGHHLVEARKNAALALIHLANLDQVPQVLACSSLLDGAVLLARSGHTRKASLSFIKRQLATAEVAVLGGILTGQRPYQALAVHEKAEQLAPSSERS